MSGRSYRELTNATGNIYIAVSLSIHEVMLPHLEELSLSVSTMEASLLLWATQQEILGGRYGWGRKVCELGLEK